MMIMPGWAFELHLYLSLKPRNASITIWRLTLGYF